ncbi:MAG TPA: TonB-dependent receptor [Caulobacteraceae bacterium]|nr:TonB-dependent receptor [Caulobacteraceae bacterium]
MISVKRGTRIPLAVLLASTTLAAAPALAQQVATAADANSTTIGEVIVTAEKRAENVQHVPISIQVLDSKALQQLDVNNFQDYVKYLPSVAFQTFAPDQTTIYIRGVADGGNANHSGPQPSVGSYLDEQPITTIGGTLDIHAYDLARVEVLAGPQGTLYGASSESGTVRFITNKPTTSGFEAGYDLQGNTVAHGKEGYVAEGFVNIPLTSNVAVRLVGFDEHDSGYINNVFGTRTFERPDGTIDGTINNAAYVKNDFNPVDTYGGRAALKWDINDKWSITPSVVAQDMRADGVFGYEPGVGNLEVQRFAPDSFHDRWIQSALTVQGKIGRYDLTYSGGYFYRAIDSLSDYTDYSVAYDAFYGSGAYWVDNAGNPLSNPQQEIVGRDRFDKQSHELRIASPSTDKLRFVAGLFTERQTHWIIQDYQIQGLGSAISVPGWPNTIWLTDQNRIDKDDAGYAEVTWDATPHLQFLGGVRGYYYANQLYGFYGYSANYSSHTGAVNCPNFPGETFRNAPCVDLNKTAYGSGQTHKLSVTWKFDPDHLIYFTYSTGYRPGGVNRSGDFGPYSADHLTNYEFGWKTQWLDRSLQWNGAIYDENWTNFQFSFLGPNSLTIIQNAPSARILGLESSVEWRATSHLTISANGNLNDAQLTANFCGTNEVTGQFIASCDYNSALAPQGTRLPYTPIFKGDIMGRYGFDLMGWDAHVQASVAYNGKRTAAVFKTDNANLGYMPAYATADFSFGVERNKLTLEIFIKNAFNSLGQVNRYTPCTTAVCSVSYFGQPAAVYVVPITPLTAGIKVSQRF